MQPFFFFGIYGNVFICFKGSKIFYEVQGTGEATVFLCGWGYGSEAIKPLARIVKGKKVFIDFPMFGKSEGLKEDWALLDYADFVYAILRKENISRAKIVGHSFGGKVAILLSAKYNITESLALVCSAGIKPRFSPRKTLAVWRYKLAKRRGKDVSGYGSADYLALPQNAKKTFAMIVNTHIEDACKDVKCKTLIIAGKTDDATPMYMQKKLHRLIKNSTLVAFDGGHFVWLDDWGAVQTLSRFLEET